MFEIEFDEKQGLMKRRLWGFWSVETANAYVAEVESVIARIKRRHPSFVTISDSKEMRLQPADVMEVLSKGMKSSCTANSGKTAILVSSVLSKLQVERLYPYANMRAFLDEQRAREWLFDNGTQEGR